MVGTSSILEPESARPSLDVERNKGLSVTLDFTIPLAEIALPYGDSSEEEEEEERNNKVE